MSNLNGRVAIVTGGASGIGLAIVERLATAGAQVVLSDVRLDAAKEQATGLASQGLPVEARQADAGAESDLKALIDETVEHYGRLDVLVNNAGMQYVAPVEDFPTDKFQEMINLMLVGPFIASKHAVPVMKAQHFGRIINMASVNGLIGFAGKAAYNAAKHGLIGLTKVLALETATHSITVNALCPGYVDTPLVRHQLHQLAAIRKVDVSQVLDDVIFPLVPQRRLLHPEEIAQYALFLASEEARGITGQAVVIDGGYLAQ
ncbi:3-hydroxybutyrate dehydrogenase [Sulfobacillus harzensis]|uniref:3-hydroxybutyrate dehydrogenase n=1 Tax=Sulfobacillus harzensis TaxID=2729629 RepID=A0A7Y0L3W5_9FIRM|nr:3-hydroxybutyrate dehydrogenase [Sulfobacillus harzensis]NMP21429.1 3-hydroxybutyrate dehydrogenase [Sulfobacillus harzensis]